MPLPGPLAVAVLVVDSVGFQVPVQVSESVALLAALLAVTTTGVTVVRGHDQLRDSERRLCERERPRETRREID